MLLHAWTLYKLRSDSLEELMAYISTNLPRRLREVLDYQPTKHNQLADIRRSGMPNPIAETHPVSLFVPLGIPGTKVFNPNSWPRATPLEFQINLNQMSPSLLERRYHQDSTHGTPYADVTSGIVAGPGTAFLYIIRTSDYYRRLFVLSNFG